MNLKHGILVFVLTSASMLMIACSGGTPTPAAATPIAVTESAVTAKGEVVPQNYARLAFNIGGTVSQIPVKEGTAIKKGDVLALLDTSDLQLQIKTAEDSLALAQATLTQTKTPATAEEIAATQASYDSAVAALDRAKKGATPTDLAAAQAAYNSALTAYNTAKNGPTQNDLQILQSQLAKAQAAVNVAQSGYDRIGGATNPFSAQTPQALQLQQATQDYQIALANYNKAVSPDASNVAAAAAQLKQAQANLQKLKDSPLPEDVAQAQAAVDSAKAQLDLKKQGARPEDVDVAQKRVDQAQTGVDQAKAALDKASLKATMEGVVTEITIREGELAQPGQAIITIADLSNLEIQTTDLDEFGTARVKIGQPATIRVNAFNDKTLTGKVSEIASQSVLLASGDVSYPITILLNSQDPDLRWGMTVKVEFQQ